MFMSFHTLSFLTALLLQAISPVSAADCTGDIGVHPDLGYIQSLANAMCDGYSCENNLCLLTTPINSWSVTSAYRSSTNGDFGSCWDAFANIIDQCFNNHNVNYQNTGAGTYGKWVFNGQTYLLDYKFKALNGGDVAPLSENGVWDEDGPVGDSGDSDQFHFGPDTFCIGTGPGGGQACVDIPDGCFVVVPLDNRVPTPICG